MKVGLRIDVDTHEGMRDGIPRLLDLLDSQGGGRGGVKATFYVAMGPDNSGRAVFGALFRKGFLRKMFRTKAVSTYGWRTILSGTLLPARPIGSSRPDLMKRIVDAGHELGPHSWDHRRWQDKLDRLSAEAVRGDFALAVEALHKATGGDVVTSAAPAWLTNAESLVFQEKFGLRFASDCRGRTPFYPRVDAHDLATLQLPATLPTLDEMLGPKCATAADYYAHVAGLLDAVDTGSPDAYHLLTVHAETEGRGCAEEFERFLEATSGRHEWAPLGEIANEWRSKAPRCEMVRQAVPGRHGEVSMQGRSALADDGEQQ